MNVAYFTDDTRWLNNVMFQEHVEWDNNNFLLRYRMLKKYLAERGFDLNTFDTYKRFESVDIWLIQEPTPNSVKFVYQNSIDPSKTIFFLHEPIAVNPWGWDFIRKSKNLYTAVLTWESQLCKTDKKFFHYHFPVTFEASFRDKYFEKRKENLCLMMHSNKASNVTGELYSFRRKVIKYFENRGDRLLDLFGFGWNDDRMPSPFFTNLYRGTVPDKWEAYSRYYYSFCIDNCIVPGYITYDPLISMSVGTVPIYVPMPDSKDFIPEDTFIDLYRFKSFDELVLYLQSIINTKEYDEYRERGWRFLTSEKYYPFTVEKYSEDLYGALRYVKDQMAMGRAQKHVLVTPEKAIKHLNPHFAKLLPLNCGITYKKMDPSALLNFKRFDVVAKYIYVKYREMGADTNWGLRLYDEHIRTFNGYDERDGTGKKGIGGFLKSFNDTVDSIKAQGFDESRSMIPVTHNDELIEGSHRLAACLYFNRPVSALCFSYDGWNYNSAFFHQRGLPESYCDAIAYEFCKLKNNTYLVLLFPSAIGREDDVKNILLKYGNIYYEKKVRLFNDGPTLLMTQVYKGEEWIGDIRNGYPGARQKAHECFKSSLPLRVFLIETDKPDLLKEAKEEIRNIYGISNHSIHINDTHEETVRVAQILFNLNSIHFLNNAQPKYFDGYYRNYMEYQRLLKDSKEDKEHYCVGGSAVMSLYGLRESRDIDYFHFGDELKGGRSSVGSHNKEILYYPTTRDDIIFNPLNHFYFDGLKFASLNIIKSLKKIRGEEKDKKDLILIDKILKTGQPPETKIAGVIFSKDRAMQLDGTIRTLMMHCKDMDNIKLAVLYTTSTPEYERQYETFKKDFPSVNFVREREFKNDLINMISPYEHVLFLVDDNIFIKDFFISDIPRYLAVHPYALGFSLRLGENITYSYMMDRPHTIPQFTAVDKEVLKYDWTTVNGGFGYPLEVSSSLYKTHDILTLLAESDFTTPNTLEVVLDTNKTRYIAKKHELLTYKTNVTFCNPVNKVQSDFKNNKSGANGEYTFEKLSEMFDKGYRIDGEAYADYKTNAYHQEAELKFISPSGNCDKADKEGRHPLTSIVILNYNGLKDIRACLDSIRRNTSERYEIIVIDNASTDGSVEYLRAAQDVALVENLVNLGCPPARAQAMSLAKGDYVVFIDNDTVVTKGWLTKFIEHMKKNPQAGIIGPRSNYVSGAQLVKDVPYRDLSELEDFAENFSAQHKGKLTPTTRLVGFCTCTSRQVVDKIGCIDASFGKFGFEDDDYTWRAYIAGFRPAIADDIFIHHSGGPQGRGNSEYDRALLNAWELFKAKWGLPANLKHGVLFDKTVVLNKPFDRSSHYIPIGDPSAMQGLIYKRPQEKTGHTDSGQRKKDLDAGNKEKYLSIEKDIAKKLYEQALLMHENGKTELAIKQFEIILEMDKDNPEAYNDIGVLHYQREQTEKAIYYLKEALRLDPENVHYKRNIADSYLKAGNIEEAVECYGDILKRCPDDVNVLLAVSHLCLQAGLKKDAKLYLDRILEIEPDNEYAKQIII